MTQQPAHPTGRPAGRPARHCRHCLLGDCVGDCLVGGGLCIHGWNEKPPRRFYWRLVVTRRWWRRVLWGIRQ